MRRIVASSGGLGFIPRRLRGSDAGAGTVGAALSIPLALLVEPVWLEVVLVAGVTALGVWAAAPFSEGDPGWVVIDETVVRERVNPTLVPIQDLASEPQERSA